MLLEKVLISLSKSWSKIFIGILKVVLFITYYFTIIILFCIVFNVLILADRRVRKNISEQLVILVGTAHTQLCIITLPFLKSLVVGFLKCWCQSTKPHTVARTAEMVSLVGNSSHIILTIQDLVPFDSHLFGPLKEFVCGTKFSGNEVKSTMSKWLQTPRWNMSHFIAKLSLFIECPSYNI